ncbi:cytochrome-c peroxidase [Flavobacteriaceae bacterium UJ101]|nr:cytochrome-c peroxidase [Flavobacteriaceae bacterium UJ101]
MKIYIKFIGLILFLSSCKEELPISKNKFEKINFEKIPNYNYNIPKYILKDNSGGVKIDNKKALLGRILFYDRKLSVDNTISCSSCHIQTIGFSDSLPLSDGVYNRKTLRHSMRLGYLKFSDEPRYFWDKRALNLLEQVISPIQDHNEMGFSGKENQPNFDSLMLKLNNTNYYTELFDWAYGNDTIITKLKLQTSLIHFIRSIHSFDSKFDKGLRLTNDIEKPFPNFTDSENKGKLLFLKNPIFGFDEKRISGGAGCAQCHIPPEFNIHPNIKNNGIQYNNNLDLTVTKSPSLRDLYNPEGFLNSGLTHFGKIKIDTIIEHYNHPKTYLIDSIDPKLTYNKQPQNLQLTPKEKKALKAFLKTLTSIDIYTNEKFTNPFY